VLELETPRLHFRKFTPDDLHALAAIRSDPDVMRYVGACKPESVEELQVRLTKVIAHWERHNFGPWALVNKETNRMIGWCGLSYLDDTGDVEIAYGLTKEHWGKGLASEAAAAAMKYGFHQLGLDRIVAVVWPENIASLRVLEKLGMTSEPRLYNGEMLFYSIFREEYQRAASAV
jgi:RimJ/RimL family protein N-acetyltransferase